MSDLRPRDGDILITRHTTEGHFEISIVPGGPQLRVQHKFQAVKHAHAYAEQTGAGVWFYDASGYSQVDKPSAKDS